MTAGIRPDPLAALRFGAPWEGDKDGRHCAEGRGNKGGSGGKGERAREGKGKGE